MESDEPTRTRMPDSLEQSYLALWGLLVPDDEAKARTELDKLMTYDLVELGNALRREIALIERIVKERMT